MKFWEMMLILLLTSAAISIFFSAIWFFKARGEKKLQSKGTIRTRPPKVFSGFFLGFGLLVLFGGIAATIYFCIIDSENITAVQIAIISVCVAGFSALGFFGYAYVSFNYVVADNEGLYAHRLFRKTKYYLYKEIGFFEDTISLGMMGGLKGYDKDSKTIFAIEAAHIGASAVAQRLREHGVKEISKGQF